MSEALCQPIDRWVWNESTNTLECSSGQYLDRRDRQKKDKRELKHEIRGASSRVGNEKRQHRRSPVRTGIKQTPEHTKVTLQDVKGVAKSMMLEVEDLSAPFMSLYSTPQFDNFLMFLLNYFHWFFEKRTKENTKNPTHIEPSLSEKRLYEELCTGQKVARKQLGHAYGALILGIGLCDQHHMACGKSLHSNTESDRSMYETLYTYCTFFVWIAFKRREHDIVKNEINEMLRTEYFNPVAHAKAAAMSTDDDEEAETPKKLTDAEYRRLRQQSNRVPLKTIMGQRSITVVSMLPLPKEQSSYLFQRRSASSQNSAESHSNEQTVQEQLEQDFAHLNMDVEQLKLGIIGEPLNLFDPVTLAFIDSDADEKPSSKQHVEPRLSTTADNVPVSKAAELSEHE